MDTSQDWSLQTGPAISLSVATLLILMLFRAWLRGSIVAKIQHDAEIQLLKEQIDLSKAASDALVKLMAERLIDKAEVVEGAHAETRGARAETLAARAEIDIQREQNHELMAQQDALIDTYQTIEGALKAVVEAFTAARQNPNGDPRPARRPGAD